MHALTDAGRSHSSAARALGLDRRTVRTYARARTWQEVVRRPPRRPSTLDPYLDHLRRRCGFVDLQEQRLSTVSGGSW
ncbi:hypothetical protein [Streptomyces sp. TE5632]